MGLTIYTSKEAMTCELTKELASYAEDLVTAVAKEHMGFNAYSKALDDFHEQCASSIKTWKYLTYELAVCEDALAETGKLAIQLERMLTFLTKSATSKMNAKLGRMPVKSCLRLCLMQSMKHYMAGTNPRHPLTYQLPTQF